MEIILVADQKTIDSFHNLPVLIYKEDKNWVPPLQMMIEDIFSPEKNAGFLNGAAKRWLIKDGTQFVGRIAAFYDRSKLEEGKEPAGNIGFFEWN